MRTGVTGLALLVKGHIHDDFADTIIEVKGSSTFFLDVFNMQPADVCSRFQQWVCNQKSSKFRTATHSFYSDSLYQTPTLPITYKLLSLNVPC
jgi:hypothetical protein